MANIRLRQSFTRPADATAYTQGDTVSNATDSTGVGLNYGGPVQYLERVLIKKSTNTALGANVLGLLFFDSNPGNIVDNAPFAGNFPLKPYIGQITFPAFAITVANGPAWFYSEYLPANGGYYHLGAEGPLWVVPYFAGTGVALGNAEQFEVNLFVRNE